MGNNPVGKKVNTPKGKYIPGYLPLYVNTSV